MCQYLAEALLEPLRQSSSVTLPPDGVCRDDKGSLNLLTFTPVHCLAAEVPLGVTSNLHPLQQEQEVLQEPPEQQQQHGEEVEQDVSTASLAVEEQERPAASQPQPQLQSAGSLHLPPDMEGHQQRQQEQAFVQPQSERDVQQGPTESLVPPEGTRDTESVTQEQPESTDEEVSDNDVSEVGKELLAASPVVTPPANEGPPGPRECGGESRGFGWQMTSRRRTSSIFVSPVGDWGGLRETPFFAAVDTHQEQHSQHQTDKRQHQMPQSRELKKQPEQQEDAHLARESERETRGPWRREDNIEELLLQSLKKHFGCSRSSSIAIVQKKGQMVEALFDAEGHHATYAGLGEWTEGMKESAAEAARRLVKEPQKAGIVVQIYYNGLFASLMLLF